MGHLAAFAGPQAIGPLEDYSGGTATGLYAFMPVPGPITAFVTPGRLVNRRCLRRARRAMKRGP